MTTCLLRGLGTVVPVTVAGERRDELLDAVHAAWARCLTDAPDAPSELRPAPVTAALHAEGGEPDAGERADVDGDDVAAVMQRLTQAVTRSAILAMAGRQFMFHAGAVCHPGTGAVLGLVARGGTGKTTLTRLLAASHGYLSDETMAVTFDGRVLPYAKPLSVRGADSSAPKAELSPDALGLGIPHPAPLLARIVLLDRDPACAAPSFEALGTVEAIAALAPESSSLSAIPQALHRLADLLDGMKPVLRLHYAEASSVLGPLTDLLADPAPRAAPTTPEVTA